MARMFLDRIPYPARLSLAHTPTPLERMPRLSERLGVEIWLKRDDLTGALTTGNKVRKLEFLAAEAKAQGADTLVTCGGHPVEPRAGNGGGRRPTGDEIFPLVAGHGAGDRRGKPLA